MLYVCCKLQYQNPTKVKPTAKNQKPKTKRNQSHRPTKASKNQKTKTKNQVKPKPQANKNQQKPKTNKNQKPKAKSQVKPKPKAKSQKRSSKKPANSTQIRDFSFKMHKIARKAAPG